MSRLTTPVGDWRVLNRGGDMIEVPQAAGGGSAYEE